ncbi:hypothetical protein [Candidatus Contubernalis alkaliaceticus]|uniref:hypothetical protein n=1 Tax=Candidatus Contubernalis alkaliaceticus TaxID=338645 RepID=UPI001F4BEDC2|nr:hypothetical protein [Candidatus Contubernalis alkalaceticus]UNC92110.1 hypothetical protein HUE98_08375 [Candidatus Contubernalis alkalaceticus]
MKVEEKASIYLAYLDKILAGEDDIGPVKDVEIEKLLLMAKTMISADFSVDSKVRESLRKKLLAQLKEINKSSRFYHKKLTSIRELFVGEKIQIVAEEAPGYYSTDLVIPLHQYSLKPISRGYYFCDITDEQLFFEKIKHILGNDQKEPDDFIKNMLKETPQIRNYAKAPSGLIVDIGILKFEPIVIVKRIVEGKEVTSMVFRTEVLN